MDEKKTGQITKNNPEKPMEARWKGEGFGDYRCSWCGEVVTGKPATCPCCHSIMS